MKTTHQTPTPVGPTCGRPCYPTSILPPTSAQCGPAGFTEPLAAIARGKLAPEFFSRLLNSLAVAFWLGYVAMPQAATVSINSYDPKAVTLGGAWVTVEVEASNVVIDFMNNDEPDWITLTLTGGTIDGGPQSQGVYGNYSVPFSFFVYDITADLVITVTGSNSDTKTIPLGKITGINLRMAQDINLPAIAEANYDQDVYIRAGLNIDPLPLPLNYDSIGWSYADPIEGSSWAKYTQRQPGHPTVYATLGGQSVNRDFWMVKLTLKEIELGGNGFREIKMDPPSTDTYAKPHWSADRGPGREAYPVLMKANQVFTAIPTFILEPTEYPHVAYVKATGIYEMDGQFGTGDAATGTLKSGTSSANISLDPSVGREKPTLTWQFKVGQSVYTSAGESVLDIYRSINNSYTDYITVVDIACKNGGTAVADVIAGIWSQFTGFNVLKYAPAPSIAEKMSFWKAPTQVATDKNGLISSGDGSCGAWEQLFIGALDVHGIVNAPDTMTPAATGKVTFRSGLLPGSPSISTPQRGGKYLILAINKACQGGVSVFRLFDNHVSVRIGLQWYDPGFGIDYPSRQAWEDDVLIAQTYGINPATSRPDLIIGHRPGIQDTNGEAVEKFELVAPEDFPNPAPFPYFDPIVPIPPELF